MMARTKRIEKLSADEARTLALRAQGLAGNLALRGPAGVLALTRAVQLDTICVLARSHELVAYARLGAVERTAVEAAYWGAPAAAFEYLAHANCIMPADAWPYFAFRRRVMRDKVAARVSPRVLDDVRARLRDAPITASDLGGSRAGPGGWWNWSEAKQALELLYLGGDAVCTTRRAWKRVYDLPERALPRTLLDHEPSDAECYAHLVAAAARALGVGTRRDIANYFLLVQSWGGVPKNARALLDASIDETGLTPVEVEGWDEPAFVDPRVATASGKIQHRTTLLSPFDSLIWERPRTQRLFDFAFSLEAYKPKDQRIHGYFTMPLLADGRLVGRVDPAREGNTLVARKITLEDPGAVDAMAAALREAASWVHCDNIRIDQVMPRGVGARLKKAVS